MNETATQRSPGFVNGFFLPFRAARVLLANRGVKRYAILPLLFNAFVYGVAILVFFYFVWEWDWIEPTWVFWGPVGGWLAWFASSIVESFKLLLLLPLAFVIAYFTFTSVGMILASPFNDMLSERVERALCTEREQIDVPIVLTLKATIFSIVDSLLIVLRQLGFTLLVAPLLLIPVIGFAPLFLVSAYFAGLGFVDTGMARNMLRNRHKRLLLRERRWQILGFGVAMQLLFLVPLMGMLLLPVGVTAGTMIYAGFDWAEALRKEDLQPPEGFIAPVIRSSPRNESTAEESPAID